MTSIRTLQRSFAGGEVTPEFWSRIDDAKYQTGLAKCRNFICKPQGPAENRAGTQFVREVKDSTKETRVIPFTYSTTQTMVIELGAGYFRFHTAGATLLYSAPAAWLTATAYAVGDIRSNGGTNYYCTTAHTSGVFATDLAASKWYALPASMVYEIPNPYAEADLFDIHFVQSADVLTLVHPGYAPRELRRLGATQWVLSEIAFASAQVAPTGVAAVPNAAGATTYKYVVTSVGELGTDESAASTMASCNGNLLAAGGYNDISWSTSGASRYYVYKFSGGVYGYIGQTDQLTFRDDNIAADVSRTPPIVQTPFNAAGDYPGAVSYFEQRRVFAGTTNKPQNIWMTKSGTESNLNYGLPLRDDDSIQFRVAAREANTIRHIVPLANLVLLTSAAEWQVTSVNSDVVTPSTISVKPQSYVGANNVMPVIISNNLIYCAARGGHVREMAYAWQASGYVTGDLSLRAPHLFDGYEIRDMAYAKAPIPTVWTVSDSGKLLGLTYIPEQQVGAWHQHDTAGLFESCAVVAEGQEDVLYTVVKRTINGQTKRYVEFLHTRRFDDQEDAFFVDSGLTYSGAVAQTLTPGVGATVADTTGVTFTAGGAAFVVGDVGKFIRYRYEETDDNGIATGEFINSIAEITGYTSATVVSATIISAFPSTSAIASGAWSLSVTTISGLTHLEGETVSILGDGAVMPQAVVAAGAVTVPQPVHVAQIGLPITADLQTLPLAFETQGYGQGREKNIDRAWLRVYKSSGIFAGPDFDNLTEVKQRTTEVWGAPPALKTEEIAIDVMPAWGPNAQLAVRQADPLPLTVTGMSLEVSIGG